MSQQNTPDFILYTKNEYADFICAHNDKVNSLPAILLSNDSTKYISNVRTQMIAIESQQEIWPVSLNKKEYNNALICSPFTTYITYPMHMMENFDTRWLKYAVMANAFIFNLLFKAMKINQVAQVNNTFNSVLKHPTQMSKQLPYLTNLLTQKYPKHSILFFRVNAEFDVDLISRLKESNYIIFPDRVTHVFHPEDNFIKRRDVQRDLKLLKKSQYDVVQHEDLTESDIERISELYRALFIKKYSKHNPVYTKFFFQDAVKYRWHHYMALRNKQGMIDAFICWYLKDNVMICGPLGHDTAIASNIGLYRMIVSLALGYANEHRYKFNMGAGSDRFKLNRGSKRVLEYTAVYCKHLSFYRQIPWRILRYACTLALPKIYGFDSIQIY